MATASFCRSIKRNKVQSKSAFCLKKYDWIIAHIRNGSIAASSFEPCQCFRFDWTLWRIHCYCCWGGFDIFFQQSSQNFMRWCFFNFLIDICSSVVDLFRLVMWVPVIDGVMGLKFVIEQCGVWHRLWYRYSAAKNLFGAHQPTMVKSMIPGTYHCTISLPPL